MKKLGLLFFIISSSASAEVLPVTFGGFFDFYYAHDSNLPRTNRAYTTQAVVPNSLSLNLGYGEMILKTDNFRGRLALQAGDSVQRNAYYERPAVRAIQEAYLGYRISENTWLDGGIFLGNIGSESWISKDNWTYTRALLLDYVPYYSAGLRLEHQFNSKQSFQFQLLQGWQVVVDNNHSKAVGMQYKHVLTEKLTFIYNNYIGDEGVVSLRDRFRFYNDFILNWLYSEKWRFIYTFDVGLQAQQTNDGVDAWFGTAGTVQRVLNTTQSLALRLEYYNDSHQANVTTLTPQGFQVVNASLNFDQKFDKNLLWRTEVRGYISKDGIYPSQDDGRVKRDGLFVTSLGISF